MSNDFLGLKSTIGRKLLMGFSGLGLVGFIIVHLAGNLLLLSPNPEHFNHYAHTLESFGELLYLAEAGLVLFFLIHIYNGVRVTLQNRRARPISYRKSGKAGGPSRKNISSKTMIWTGLVLLAFLIWHLINFKFGSGVSEGYVVQINGEEVRDLHRLVVESFKVPWIVGIYVAVMLLLGSHLRHGFWSAFQSLGVNHPRYTPLIYGTGVALAFLLGIGFLLIPIWIYFFK